MERRLAAALKTVVGAAGGAPVTLVGHSIGGMMILTLARLYPEMLGREVSRIVLVNTTYTYPLNTIIAGGLLKALLPLITVLLYLTIWLWPVVWLMNLQSYLNGSSHLVNRLTSFSRAVSRGQLDFGAWFTVKAKPSVAAEGLLAALRWDEAATLSRLTVPTRVITADADRITLPGAAEHMHRTVPTSDLVRGSPRPATPASLRKGAPTARRSRPASIHSTAARGAPPSRTRSPTRHRAGARPALPQDGGRLRFTRVARSASLTAPRPREPPSARFRRVRRDPWTPA